MSIITKRFPIDLTVSEGERAVVAKINTAVMDRDGEVVLPLGCDATEYEANPVVFFMHDHWSLPVGKCVSLKRETDSLSAKMVFAARPENHPAEKEWLPDTLLALYQQGVMSAFSIGFSVIESRQPSKKDLETYGGECRRVISKWKLLEFSPVTIPANQEAVALAVSKAFTPEQSPEAKPEPVAPATEPVVKAVDPKPAIVPAIPRKLLYVITNEIPAADMVAVVGKAVGEQLSKRRGRIYIV